MATIGYLAKEGELPPTGYVASGIPNYYLPTTIPAYVPTSQPINIAGKAPIQTALPVPQGSIAHRLTGNHDPVVSPFGQSPKYQDTLLQGLANQYRIDAFTNSYSSLYGTKQAVAYRQANIPFFHMPVTSVKRYGGHF